MPKAEETAPKPRKKVRLAIDMQPELMERIRDLVYYLQRRGTPDDPDTMAGLVTSYIEDGIERTLKKHKRKKVPKRPEGKQLRQGRRLRA